jgi:hypothetical protein
MAVPAPNSPEARRAAQKVRNIFYMIAAANFVIIAIVLWPTPAPPAPNSSPLADESAANAAVLAEMERLNERLLAAYQARDAQRFAQEFSSAATPRPDEEYFRSVVLGQYYETFGEITAKTRSPETNPVSDPPVLIHDFVSRKGLRGKSTTTFTHEGGQLRVLQWRLDPL